VPQQKEEKVRKNMEKNRGCYKCEGLDHMKKDHGETKRQTKLRWQKKESKVEKEKKEKRKEKE